MPGSPARLSLGVSYDVGQHTRAGATSPPSFGGNLTQISRFPKSFFDDKAMGKIILLNLFKNYRTPRKKLPAHPNL